MIEINLIPDVKQEFLRAKRVRNTVITGAIVASVISLGAVVLLGVYAYGGQPLRSVFEDSQIDKKFKELKEVEDLEDILTLQSQLSTISDLHKDKKIITSRLFDVLSAINPKEEDTVRYTNVRLDAANKTMYVSAEAKNGYAAAEAFEKSILATQISYREGDEVIKKAITESVTQSEQNFGDDQDGGKILRFTLSFEYTPELFSTTSTNLVVNGPERQDATDSYRRVPVSLFSDRVSNERKDN